MGVVELSKSVEVQLRPPEIPSKCIELTQGKVTLVDSEDYESLSKHKWHARKDGKTFYAYRRSKNSDPHVVPFLAMHRVILGVVDEDVEVDHRNGDGLDNRRCNLRIATRSLNASNRISNNKGVVYDSRYKSRPFKARFAGQYLGQFATREEAEQAYDEARRIAGV